MKNILQETFEKHANLVRKHFNLNEAYNDPTDPSGMLNRADGRFAGIPNRSSFDDDGSNEPSVDDVIRDYNGPVEIMDGNEQNFIESIAAHLSNYYPTIDISEIQDVVNRLKENNDLNFTSDDVIRRYMDGI